MINLIILCEAHLYLLHHASSDWASRWVWACWCIWA